MRTIICPYTYQHSITHILNGHKIHEEHPENIESLQYLEALCKDLGRPHDEFTRKLDKLRRALPATTQQGDSHSHARPLSHDHSCSHSHCCARCSYIDLSIIFQCLIDGDVSRPFLSCKSALRRSWYTYSLFITSCLLWRASFIYAASNSHCIPFYFPPFRPEAYLHCFFSPFTPFHHLPVIIMVMNS